MANVNASRVAVWDRDDRRFTRVDDACIACGVRAARCASVDALVAALRDGRCAAGVVGLGEPPERGEAGIEIVGRMHDAGLVVVAHEDGVDAWPLRSRCRVLLAGALDVLDSEAPDFDVRLRAILQNVLRAARERGDEACRIRALAREHGIVGASEPLLEAFRQVVRTAPLSDLPVLISGESGTGKELFATALHALDPKRCARPMVAVNCAAISAGVAESELFGHVRGAFTGAAGDHRGLFLTAHGGVLLLDEVGEMSLDVQAKLLRVLQEQRVSRVGAEQEAPIDVRVVAATNQDLVRMVEQGRFRADLFHRLDTLTIHIPPLRERADDLAPLVEHFLAQRPAPAARCGIAPDLIDALASLELAGNVRELRNLVLSALAAKSDAGPLGLRHLPARAWRELSGALDARAPATASPAQSFALEITQREGWNLSRCLDQCEREIVQAAMQRASNNQSQAARLLGVTPRSIYNKLRKHQLTARTVG